MVFRNVTAAGRIESLPRRTLTLSSLYSPSDSPSNVRMVLVMTAGPRPELLSRRPAAGAHGQAYA